MENILTLGKLLSLWFCFLLHSILFLISQTSYRTYKNNFKLLARSPHNGNHFSSNTVLLVGFYRTILTLSMRAFGPRISAYAFGTSTDIHTDRHTYIYHAKSRLNTLVWGSLRSPNYVSFLLVGNRMKWEQLLATLEFRQK